MPETWVTRIAEWAVGVRFADVPADVIGLCRRQTASVLAACYAADRLPATRVFRRTLAKLSGGDAEAAPFFDKAGVATACGITAGLSIALDFDDYLFLGHTGHSAVAVALVLGAHLRAPAETALLAQVIADEVEGRIGASVMLGPHNGQLWSFIHAAGASLAASKLLRLDAGRSAHALALALHAPSYPFFSTLMGPDAKLLLASESTAAGVRAAFLAREGFTGPLDVLDDPKGFYSAFSFAPLRPFLDGLGRSWVTHTLAFKPYPGCAYIDAAIDATLDIAAEFRNERGRELKPDDVARIDVAATLLTTQMEALGASHSPRDGLPPVFNLAFRIPHNVAIALLAGRLTSAELSPRFLNANRDAILSLASRVSLCHDARLTMALARAFVSGLSPLSLWREISFSDLRRLRRDFKARVSHESPLDLASISDIARHFTREDLFRLNRRRSEPRGSLADVDFQLMRLPFAARVALRTTDGRNYKSARDIPDGAPGGKDHPAAAERKFLREAAHFLGKRRAEEALKMILSGSDPGAIMEGLRR